MTADASTADDVGAPPFPDDTLSKGWRFELHMEKVKKSDTWLRARTGFVRAHLLLLWSEAWEQTPCGTLPNDDELIALLLDMEPETFAKHRAVLMRGWTLASNGRLYHETITDRVHAMLEKRMKDAQRTAASRARRNELPPDHDRATGASRVTPTGGTSEFGTKHQNQNQNQNRVPSTGTGDTPPKAPRKRRAAAAQLVSVEQLVADGVEQQHANEWLAIRATKNLPLTPTAWEDVKEQAQAVGMSTGQAIKHAVIAGWAGFKSKWIDAERLGDAARTSGAAARSGGAVIDTEARDAQAMQLLGIEGGDTHEAG